MNASKTRTIRGCFVTCIIAFALTLSVLSMAPSGEATNGVEKEMNFLLHYVNATEIARPLPGGGSTLTYFDTTLEFNDKHVTVTVSGTNINLDFYLVPSLAGDFSMTGYAFKIWSRFVSGASNDAQVTVQVYDRLTSGAEVLVSDTNFGSVRFAATPELKVFSATTSPHVFEAQHSIKIRFSITPGFGKTFEFYYDTPQMNSRVGFISPDSIDVTQVTTLDHTGNPTSSLDPEAANETMYFRATVTNPVGGYDVKWVNLTVFSPTGVVLIDNASMERVSGTLIDFTSVFEFSWNYSGQPPGEYRALVWALDNNGHNNYYFFQLYSFGDYPDVAETVFYIGALPYYAWFLVVDSIGVAVSVAEISLTYSGNPIDSGTTDTRGMVNLTVYAGIYDFEVVWTGVPVAVGNLSVSANITEQDPFVITAAVYYPSLRTLDSKGVPLSNAAIYLRYANGSWASSPLFTNDLGIADLGRLSGGMLEARVLWRGVEVAYRFIEVDRNSPPPIDVITAVYYLTVKVSDSRNAPVADAQVILFDVAYGLVADTRITDAQGQIVSRLPTGTYGVEVVWNDVVVSSGTEVLVDRNGFETVFAEVFYVTVLVVDSRSAPIPDCEIAARAPSGRIFTVTVSDAAGEAVLRVPATTVLLEAKWLGVPVGTTELSVEGNLEVTFQADVYTLSVLVVGANGKPISGAQVSVGIDGRIYALEVTNETGSASVRLPIGTYLLEARFTATYLYTYVDASKETTVNLNDDVSMTIELDAYPPPLTRTVAFGFGVLVLAVAAVLSFVFYKLGRRGPLFRKTAGSPGEMEKEGEQK